MGICFEKDIIAEKYAYLGLKLRAEEEIMRFEKNMVALPSKEVFDKAYEIICKKEIEQMIFYGVINSIEGATELIYAHCEESVLDLFYSVWMDMNYTGTPAQAFHSLVENVIKRIKKEHGYEY